MTLALANWVPFGPSTAGTGVPPLAGQKWLGCCLRASGASRSRWPILAANVIENLQSPLGTGSDAATSLRSNDTGRAATV